MTGGVHQFVHELLPRDAMGAHTLLLRRALRDAGWRSDIYVETECPETAAETTSYRRYAAEPGDVLVYQLSFSPGLTDFLSSRSEPLVLSYHNVTPPELWAGWDDGIAAGLAAAIDQLHRLAPLAALGLAVSRFNERELRAAGCRHTAVAGVLVDFERLDDAPDPAVARRLGAAKAAGGADWLFVGRIAPSKGVEDLVKALWAYRRLYDPSARLHVVGQAPSARYQQALYDFVEDLGLGGAVRFEGEVSDAGLSAFYGAADVYVCASRHEGFGVPLIEAMRAGIPVVALGAAAVPDTVGDAGIVVPRPDPVLVAAAVQRVCADKTLRRRMVEAGRARAGRHSLGTFGRQAVDAIAAVAGARACA